ncbi:MAG: MOSC domain-containing protein [Planctomycetota bacterium]
MLDDAGTIKQLLSKPLRPGVVEWIGLSAERQAEITPVGTATARVGTGLDGDHHSTRRKGGKRQVTLIQAEHLAAVASFLGIDAIDPADLRRNVVVRGINLLALKERQFRIGGDAGPLLEGTGPCAPCSRMEETLGEAGYAAMRGHGGLTARVLEEGTFGVGDRVTAVTDE